MNPSNPKQGSEPRKHHFVPKCWLRGFTETGKKDGRLWVTDFSLKKQGVATPGKIGWLRDFYRLSDPAPDPVFIENQFSKLETAIAPVLKILDSERRAPRPDELDSLIEFMAVQWVRVPAYRPFAFRTMDSVVRKKLAEELHSPETWLASLRAQGISPDAPGVDYEGAKAYFESPNFGIEAETDWYIDRAFRDAQGILPLLRQRHWGSCISENGRFIASDNPVCLDGARAEMVGFKNAAIVVYPVSRHVALAGTLRRASHPSTLNYIAQINTMMMLTADTQV